MLSHHYLSVLFVTLVYCAQTVGQTDHYWTFSPDCSWSLHWNQWPDPTTEGGQPSYWI